MTLSSLVPNNILYWEGTDSSEKFKEHWDVENFPSETRKRLAENGYFPETIIEYRIDHYGLRNQPNVDISNSMLALGCSFTFGTGLDVVDTWVYRLGDKLGESMYNAGVPGSSNDTAFRVANYLIPKYNPKAVFLLSTFESRYEFYGPERFYDYNAANGDRVWITDGLELSTELHDTLNTKKNILAIKWLCDESNIPFNCISVNDVVSENDDRARDLAHWGRETNNNLANQMKNLLLDI